MMISKWTSNHINHSVLHKNRTTHSNLKVFFVSVSASPSTCQILA